MNPPSPRFTVGLVGKAVEQFERLAARAEQLALRDLLASVYRQIIEELETRPREWGDPFHNYRGLNATAYQRAILPAGLCRIRRSQHRSSRVDLEIGRPGRVSVRGLMLQSVGRAAYRRTSPGTRSGHKK
jgi:hypothetical protein